MTLSIIKLRKVINDEIVKRNLSMRELAKAIGVSQSTLSRIMDETKSEYAPDTDTFVKIAYGINLTASELMAIVMDEAPANFDNALLLAKQIEALPDSSREVIEQIIVGFHTRNGST